MWMWAGMCGRSPAVVPICQRTLAPLSLLPSIPPGCLCRRDPPRGDKHRGQGLSASAFPSHSSRTQLCGVSGANLVCHPEEAAGGLLPDFTCTEGISLARASASLFAQVPTASPGHQGRPRRPRPRRAPPASARRGPGRWEPALPSLLTLIKILQHGGRKCIFSSSAAAIRLPGNGWLAGGQGSGGPRRRGRRAERRDEPMAPGPPSCVCPCCARLCPPALPAPGRQAWIWSLLLWEMG